MNYLGYYDTIQEIEEAILTAVKNTEQFVWPLLQQNVLTKMIF